MLRKVGYNSLMDTWSVAHRYNKLVKAGLATPLTGIDGVQYILRADENFEPVWWHPVDDTYLKPGLVYWQKVSETVDQSDLDNLDAAVLELRVESGRRRTQTLKE
jgi:hypothetical protein